MTQFLTAKEVAQNALKAYNEKRLGAQIPDNDNCLYLYPNGSKCAIGVSLNEETLGKVCNRSFNGSPVWSLKHISLVSYYDYEAGAIITTQELHDKWCSKHGTDKDLAERDFIDHINIIVSLG